MKKLLMMLLFCSPAFGQTTTKCVNQQNFTDISLWNPSGFSSVCTTDTGTHEGIGEYRLKMAQKDLVEAQTATLRAPTAQITEDLLSVLASHKTAIEALRKEIEELQGEVTIKRIEVNSIYEFLEAKFGKPLFPVKK
jgi:hypothetical protein